MYKICNQCGENKEESSFLRLNGGYGPKCKACNNLNHAKRQADKKAGTFVSKWDLDARKAKFKEDGLALHEGIYTYDRVVYKDFNTKVEIFCTKHQGYFWQTPSSHLGGNGCIECYNNSHAERGAARTLTQGDFVEKTHAAHGDKYTLMNAIYTGALNHVWVTCPKHGDFSIAPHNLWAGYGCPDCAKSGYNKSKPGHIYVLQSDDLTKIGITNNDVAKRVTQLNRAGKNFTVLYSELVENGTIPLAVESALKLCLKIDYRQPLEKFQGYTECYYDTDVESIIKLIQRSVECIKDYDDRYRRHYSIGED